VAPYNVVIADDVVIQPNASVMERTSLGKGTIVGPNSTIGADAYEIVNANGTPELITQAGGVSVGEGVVFLASVTISRSSFPVMTQIGDFCSFDNQVHVAHDCVLGKNVKMTACSMLSGRVELGDNAYIGPNATISNGVTIGRNARISLGSVVASDIPDNAHVSGNFAMDHKTFLRAFRNLRSA
jgi:UDP-3-O-[3-hydroxymyristoyl] glucosamine N-acyltransferase